jgi:hypothetical protein
LIRARRPSKYRIGVERSHCVLSTSVYIQRVVYADTSMALGSFRVAVMAIAASMEALRSHATRLVTPNPRRPRHRWPTFGMFVVAFWVSLGMLLASSTASAFVFRGGGGEGASDGGASVFITFRANNRPGRKAHGIIIGTRRVNRKGRPVGGPSMTILVNRRGRLRCVARTTTVLDGRCLDLDGDGCGVGRTHYCLGITAGIVTHALSGGAGEEGASIRVGHTVRSGDVTCIVLSNQELLRLYPDAVSTDVIACRTADSSPFVAHVFKDGATSADCGSIVDPATGCLISFVPPEILAPECLRPTPLCP